MRIIELFVALFCALSRQTAGAYVLPSRLASSSPAMLRTMTVHSSPAFTKPRPPVSLQQLNVLSTSSANDNDTNEQHHLTLRDRMRQVTGFSFTAFRATLRGITGISLTAIYASAVATTSSFVRNTMKVILSVFPTWVRVYSCCCWIVLCASCLNSHTTTDYTSFTSFDIFFNHFWFCIMYLSL